MADTKGTKATMAPAARDPEGASSSPGAAESGVRRNTEIPDEMHRSLQAVSRDELLAMRARIDAELGRIGSGARSAEPSFGISEGTRQELEQREALPERERGVVTSPFTGRPIEGTEPDAGK